MLLNIVFIFYCHSFFIRGTKNKRATWGFVQAGLDIVTLSVCKAQQLSQLDE
jgi:hypothetical protein